MQLRQLGRSGLTVPPLAFGGNVFGWTVGEADAFSLLDAMVDAGLNFIDTADVYSRWAPGNRGGESVRRRYESLTAAAAAEVVGPSLVVVFRGGGFGQDLHFADGVGFEEHGGRYYDGEKFGV